MEETKRTYKKHKQGYKIGINYFLNKHKKADINPITGVECFPLYITILVKRKSTTIRSRLNVKLPLDSLSDFLNSKEIEPYVLNEKKIIETTIKSLKPDEQENFQIQDWYKIYQHGLISFYNLAYNATLLEIISFLKEKEILTKPTDEYLDVSLSLLSEPFLKYRNDPSAQYCYGLYLSLEAINLFDLALKSRSYLLKRVPNLNFTFSYHFCIWDVLSHFYQEEIVQHMDRKRYAVEDVNMCIVSFKSYVEDFLKIAMD